MATTAAVGCILGLAIAETADADALTQAYGEFQQEVLDLNPPNLPETVNTDGWDATQQAWQRLFPGITLMLCFLHTVLNIQNHCRRLSDVFVPLTDKLWHLYASANPAQFGQRLRRLREWAKTQPLPESVAQQLEKLPAKAPRFKRTFDYPDAYRTSNPVDRLIRYQDRILFAMQYFHGTPDSTRLAVRAMAMLWNFHPYTQKVQALEPHSSSPFEDLNGWRYHNNWLRNLLIASSLNGRSRGIPNKHKLD